jgi:hypothetical protein
MISSWPEGEGKGLHPPEIPGRHTWSNLRYWWIWVYPGTYTVAHVSRGKDESAVRWILRTGVRAEAGSKPEISISMPQGPKGGIRARFVHGSAKRPLHRHGLFLWSGEFRFLLFSGFENATEWPEIPAGSYRCCLVRDHWEDLRDLGELRVEGGKVADLGEIRIDE